MKNYRWEIDGEVAALYDTMAKEYGPVRYTRGCLKEVLRVASEYQHTYDPGGYDAFVSKIKEGQQLLDAALHG